MILAAFSAFTSQLLEQLEASQPYLYDLLLICACGALFFGVAKGVRWFLRRQARQSAPDSDEGIWEREMLKATRRILTPFLTLVGIYIAFRYIERHEPERYRDFFVPEMISGFLYVLVLCLSVWFVIRCAKVWLGWYRIQLQSDPNRKDEEAHVRPIIIGVERILKVVLIIGAVIVGLRHFKQDVSSLLVSLGIGSLVIGLAAQDTMANMLAGFLILIDRPFTLGDRVQLSTGETGEVVDIGLRSSHLQLGSGALLIVANKELAQQRLINLSPPESRLRVALEFSCALDADWKKIEAAAEAAAEPSHPFAPNPAYELQLISIDGARRYSLSVWAASASQRGAAVDMLARRVLEEFGKAGIEIVASNTVKKDVIVQQVERKG